MPDTRLDRARYRRILRFAAWQFAVQWWYEIALPFVGLGRIAERTRADRMQAFARRFRGLAVELGGLMIKLGQFMSSRLDVLPPEITKELEGLQDEVPAVPFTQLRELAESELGRPLAEALESIDPDPVAAASLGQVHRARLREADAAVAGFAEVVVKIQRPGIGAIVDVDLAALRRVARWLMKVRGVRTRVDMPALIEEFAAVSREEVDYLHEAAASERFAELFSEDPRVHVPRVVWERTSRRVLVLEDVSAIKITDHAALREAEIAPAAVARVFAEVMLDQFFVHGYFHADPHPGNLFVTPDDSVEQGWRLTIVDFGMMGEVPANLRAALRSLVIAVAARDGAGLVKAMNTAGVLLPTADTKELEKALSSLFGRFGGMGFAELKEVDPREFRAFAAEFGDLVLDLPFQMPEDFLLIIRALSLTSGVSTALDPAYNVWDTVEPYAQQLLRDETKSFAADAGREAVEIVRFAWGLPRRLDGILSQLEAGDLPVSAPRLEGIVLRLERTASRLVSGLIFAAVLLAGALVHAASPGLGTTLMVLSVIPLIGTVFGGRGGR
ncbi:AarF/ABC1/UbiB kinase family protein [Demequina sp. NBRC 110057]|uniref:ABC1 kinase family protein n=1 Tax=Demequina sp. NBRC 110057 TaxID=1570346 RepID=UPI000A01B449|nr:AarF/UbiB family protein [Demequina sp. NBRC 110057]